MTTCGKTNGVLSIHYAHNYSTFGFKWMNANHDSKGNQDYINQLPPGTYYLKAYVLTVIPVVTKHYGPYAVRTCQSTALNMAPQITTATCSQANGGITGITASNVTGTPFMQWTDSLNRPVGNIHDLATIRPGKYRLKFKDQGSVRHHYYSWYHCSRQWRHYYRPKQAAHRWPATVMRKQDLYAQLQVTNGDTYQWTNTATNQVAEQFCDVYNLAAGSYQLTGNQCNRLLTICNRCCTRLQRLRISALPQHHCRKAFCNQNNGFVTVNSFSQDQSQYAFRWVNQNTGVIAGNRHQPEH